MRGRLYVLIEGSSGHSGLARRSMCLLLPRRVVALARILSYERPFPLVPRLKPVTAASICGTAKAPPFRGANHRRERYACRLYQPTPRGAEILAPARSIRAGELNIWNSRPRTDRGNLSKKGSFKAKESNSSISLKLGSCGETSDEEPKLTRFPVNHRRIEAF